ncbi:tryptophan dimethylallyltransferase-domain-containing protein [Mycena albidolilacea]|uniref:Tryptophan dimethylallyltransferase-domain-containing protein n=1 Tax=Mycena albidolilacea TaxID=1033008 RepID=A0AAD7EGB0_9AGAR|nr:tryptophan dimethylallyltransferase-domain-containing protein [Mycena albidolilacea]
MQNLVQNKNYFPQSAGGMVDTIVDGPVPEVVKQVVVALLGEKALGDVKSEGLSGSVFDILTQLLPPLPSRAAFWWTRLGKPFASMLETGVFPVAVQARFLTFIYARVLGFMGPDDKAVGPGSVMTSEGGPVELSWVIPNRAKPAAGDVTRQLRFCIEPRDPETGLFYKGASVLEYFTGLEGSLGVVSCPDLGLDWPKKTENYLFPDDKGSEPPFGSRFFVGFDFYPSGTISLKAYYVTLFCPPTNQIQVASDTGKPLDKLLAQLHPTLSQPFEAVKQYIEGIEAPRRPHAAITAMDCVQPDVNRLKIYLHRHEGTSWSEARAGFTLNGALETRPNVAAGLEKLESLWNLLFPTATSAQNIDIPEVAVPVAVSGDDRPAHPSVGLLFYYEMYSNDNIVYPKIYLPVRTYCESDLTICDAVEKFYNTIGVEGPAGGERGEGWVAREVAKSYAHRKLDARCGIITYVTLGAKKGGWEVTMYFTPEPWAAERK